MSSITRADGICHSQGPSLWPPHEGIPGFGWPHAGWIPFVMAQGQCWSWAPSCQGSWSLWMQACRLGQNSRGPVCEGPLECGPPAVSHNFLEMSAVFLSLKHFLPSRMGHHVLMRTYRLLRTQPWKLPLRMDLVSQGGVTLFHPHPEHMALWACGPEQLNLPAVGLSRHVISTTQSTRVSSTRSLYDCMWKMFEGWCHRNGHILFQCPVGVILSFLQDLIDKSKAFSTVKVYLAAITAYHVGSSKPAPAGLPFHEGSTQASSCVQTTGTTMGLGCGSGGA